MIHGSCLCGGVRFEVERLKEPFELCHCNRCRKSSGSAFLAMVGADPADFCWTEGRELVAHYDAPILERPPAYRRSFCSRCGSPVPDPDMQGSFFELPAGCLDDDPGVRPDKHIFTDFASGWYEVRDDLPRLDKATLRAQRIAAWRAAHPEESGAT